MSKKWLSQLKEGDMVVLHSWSAGYSCYIEETVQKVTPKGFIKVNGSLFNPNDGMARSRGSWSGSCLMDANDESVKEQVKKYRMECYVGRVLRKIRNIPDLTYEQAIEIDRILGDVEK